MFKAIGFGKGTIKKMGVTPAGDLGEMVDDTVSLVDMSEDKDYLYYKG